MDGKEDRIRQLAHEFWLEEGKPEGREKEHWERARRQVEVDQLEAESAAPWGQTPTVEKSLPSQKKPASKRTAKAPSAVPRAKGTSREKPKRSASDRADEST